MRKSRSPSGERFVVPADFASASPIERMKYIMLASGSSRAARAILHAEAAVVRREPAPADAEVEPAVAELIDGGDVLREVQRMRQRQHRHGEADLHALGARGDGGGDRQR